MGLYLSRIFVFLEIFVNENCIIYEYDINNFFMY